MKDPLKPRDKITQKMTRDGLIEVNETKETAERVSRREQEADFSKPQEQPAPQAAQEAAAQNVQSYPLFLLTLPRFLLRQSFPTGRTPLPPSASWSALAQPRPGKRVKRQRRKHSATLR